MTREKAEWLLKILEGDYELTLSHRFGRPDDWGILILTGEDGGDTEPSALICDALTEPERWAEVGT